jgi:hypothetical protein
MCGIGVVGDGDLGEGQCEVAKEANVHDDKVYFLEAEMQVAIQGVAT